MQTVFLVQKSRVNVPAARTHVLRVRVSSRAFRGAICSSPTLTLVPCASPRRAEAAGPGPRCRSAGRGGGPGQSPLLVSPHLLSPGVLGKNGAHGEAQGWHGVGGDPQSSPRGRRAPPRPAAAPRVDLVDHSGLGVSTEASFTPLCIRPLHTACWGPGRFRLQAPDLRPGPCYRPHVPAPGASLWAGPASMGEDGGWSTEPPPAAASTGPKASPGRGEGFADSHAGQRAVTGGKKMGKWPERKNSHRPLAAGPYFSILLRSCPRARGL